MTTTLSATGRWLIASCREPRPRAGDEISARGLLWRVGRCVATQSGGSCKVWRDGKTRRVKNPAAKWYCVTPISVIDGLTGAQALAKAEEIERHLDMRRGEIRDAADGPDGVIQHTLPGREDIAPALARLEAVPGYAEAFAAAHRRAMERMMAS